MDRLALDDRKPKKWAVLIGVNFYMPGTARRPTEAGSLNGCINDIELVEKYLLDRQSFEPCCIRKLTASFPRPSSPCDAGLKRDMQPGSTTNSLAQPPEPRGKWPTYENMVHAFESVTTDAEKDDIVYVHYSGHGGRAVTILPELKPGNPYRPDRPGIDESLIPTDFNLGGRYLRDVEISALLKRMVDKGLHVTAVLDCCHSGGAGRNGDEAPGSSIRSIGGVLDGSVDWIRLETDRSDLSEAELKSAVELGVWRHSDALESVLQPQGWVMIAACLPSERAMEHEFPRETDAPHPKVHGDLTYWLVKTLRSVSGNISHGALHRRVREVVQKGGKQTPVILGNIRRQLFLSTASEVVHTIAVANMRPQYLQLRGGRAQGVCCGDVYGIFSWDGSRREDFTSPLAEVRVTVVRDIDSDAVFESQSSTSRVDIGSQALLLRRTLPSIDLRLTLMSYPDTPKTGKLMLDCLRESDITKYAGGSTRITIDDRNDQSSSEVKTLQYYITVNEQNQYEMHKSEDLTTTPLPPCDTPESLLAHAMHMGRYHQVLELENPAWPSPDFEFEPLPSSNPSRSYDLEKNIFKMADGDTFTVRFQNNTSTFLYLTIFYFTSQWGVFKVYPEDGEFEEVDWSHHRDIKIGPQFPEQFASAPYVVETVKAFVSTKPTSFRPFEIPELDSKSRGSEFSAQLCSSRDIQSEEQLRHNLSTFDSPRSLARNLSPQDTDHADLGSERKPPKTYDVQGGTGEKWQTKGIVLHVYPSIS